MSNKYYVFILLFILAIERSALANSLEQIMMGSYSKSEIYITPSAENLTKAQGLFEQLLKSKTINPKSIDDWSQIGFSLKQISEAGNTFAVIEELDTKENGGQGFYIIKLSGKGSDTSTVIEIIHRPSDLHTHKIGFKMFMEGAYVAAAFNTASRKVVDLGKKPESYYNSFTKAVAGSYPNPKIIQLHGFEGESHGIEFQAIVSSTKKTAPSLVYEQVSSCTEKAMEISKHPHFKVALHNRDIENLGGTLNINAKNFYSANPDGLFFHVEMQEAMRILLRDHGTVRQAFSQCFERW
jgi:hypothetical protein